MTDRKATSKKRAREAPSTRPKRAAKPSRFLRDGGDAQALTDLGCPDCRGVLSVDDRGRAGFLSFRCRVGHAFSLESLVPFKEDQLEDALWTAVEVCDELVSIYEYVAAQMAESSSSKSAPAQRRMIECMRRHAKQLRDIVADTGPAPLDRPRSRGT